MDLAFLDYATNALVTIVTGPHLFYLAAGVMVGLTVGLLPGLGGISGMALILPFIYGMEPGAALAMMIGVTAVTTTSDTFPSVLMGIPGSSGSQATVLDGFPLAKRGEGARALGAAFSASLLGGVFGALVLSFTLVMARPYLLKIGFAEQLMLVVFALTLVGMLTGPSMIKGLVACGVGLLLGTVGAATATGQYRMTYEQLYLTDGLPLVVVALGLFAIPEIVDVLRRHGSISGQTKLGRGWMDGVRDTLRHPWLVTRCAGIGALIGAMPGLGGSVVDWIAYGHVVQTSKDKSQFGKGDIRGVIAPESANNAKEGGALIPTLLLGIPGSGSMALLLGGLVLIGVSPGRSMVTTNIDLSYIIIWSIALANILGAAVCIAVARPIALLTTVRYNLIAPFMIVLIFFAAFQASRVWADLIALICIGLVGIYMRRFGWSRAAILIGFVLSSNLEAAFYRSAQIYGFDIFTRPISLFLIALTVLSVVFTLRNRTSVGDDAPATEASNSSRWPQIIFALLVGAAIVAVVVDVYDLRHLSRFFPLTVAAITGGLLLFMLLTMLLRPKGVIMYDAEAEHRARRLPLASTLRFVGWLVLLPIIGSVTGFFLAAPIFVALFLRIEGRASPVMIGLSAAGIAALLAALGQTLTLRYPAGLLQRFLDLPGVFA
jgi:putative tricarboxylic transport membrane protein